MVFPGLWFLLGTNISEPMYFIHPIFVSKPNRKMYQRFLVLFICTVARFICFGQALPGKLALAFENLSKEEQFRHAILSLYVVDSKTGKLIFEKNSELGLAPASCQKIITSVTAFELLGRSFRFKTYLQYDRKISDGRVGGNLYITGGGDPTLGSDRWKSSSPNLILQQIGAILRRHNIRSVSGDLVANDIGFTGEPLPSGWVWEDIGNYYGAGAWGLNWRENQFDVTFKTGAIGEGTQILSTDPPSFLQEYNIANFVKTGERGSVDNAYLYSAPFHKSIIARGTVPPSTAGFTISGSMPDPPATFTKTVYESLKASGVSVDGEARTISAENIATKSLQGHREMLDSILSPTLDSVNYWFLKKSINLYGEALVKIMAIGAGSASTTDSGINVIRSFWSKHGIEPSALKLIDGSGLSPANRITTRSLVNILQFAKPRPWFPSFYNALPELNGIKMKDGYISGVRSYTGYVRSANGREYSFAFIVNNFDGNPGRAREKIWALLDILKRN